MAFVRSKTINGKKYYYYVESYRVGSSTKQKTLEYLGAVVPKNDSLKALKEKFSERKIQRSIRGDLKYKPKYSSQTVLNAADELKASFKGKLASLSPRGQKELENRFKTGYTYHSCSIEGNTLSRAQVDMVINKNESVAGKKVIELLEVKNHAHAIDYMTAENGDLSEDFIKRLHGVLTEGLAKLKNDPNSINDFDPMFVEGDYRKDERFISGADFVPVHHDLVKQEMKSLIKFYHDNKYLLHPLELASEFHLQFVTIHPFSDGNGRMGRLLMNFILDRSSYPMIDISSENREGYLSALATGKSGPLTKFLYEELENYMKNILH